MRASLVQDLGMRPGEGLVVAYIPDTSGLQLMGEQELPNGILYTIGPTAVDIIDDKLKPVKWWVLKNVARGLGFNHPEPIWHGPVEDFGVHCLPNRDKPAGTHLAVRQYARGPWVTLTDEDLANYE